jgi:hypothetical protein
MSRFNSRLDRLEHLLMPGDCLECGNATTALLDADEPAPPPCPSCGREVQVVRIVEEIVTAPPPPS